MGEQGSFGALVGELAGETSVVPATPSTPARGGVFTFGGSDGFVGMEGINPKDMGMEIPKLRLIHKIDRAEDEGKPGWYRLGTSVYPSIQVVLLRPAPFRMLTQGEDKDTRTVCASEDLSLGKPHSGVEYPKDVYCATCAYAQWDDNPSNPEKRRPPQCKIGHAWLGMYPGNDDLPFVFVCKGQFGLEASESFFRDAATTQFPRGEQKAIARFLVTLTSRRIEPSRKGGFPFYAPVFSAELRPEAEMLKYIDVAKAAIDYKHRVEIRGSEPKVVDTSGNAGVGGGPGNVNANSIPF